MRFLANENIPFRAVERLRHLGHDVAWVRLERPGISDVEVLDWAVGEERILLTLDKDFGELAFRAGLPAACGVVLLRVSPPTAETVTTTAERLFDAPLPLAGHFTVVDERRIRNRPLG